VARVGGLVDTVVDLDEEPEEGTGILFEPTTPAFLQALQRSLHLFAQRERMDAVIRRGMTRDFSWQKAAGAYEELYQGML
jgi:starch synthase